MLTMLFVVLRFGSIVQWKLGDYMFIFIFANLSYGLRNIFMGSFRGIPWMIVNGQLDSVLPSRSIYCSIYPIRFDGGDLISDFIGYAFILFADLFTVDWGLLNTILYLLAVISGSLVQGAITLAISCVAFYMMDVKSIDNLYSGFREFIWYPLNIFNKVIQVILFTAVPLAYASFVPSGIFLRNSAYFKKVPIGLLYLSLAVGPLLFGLSYQVWKKALKRYASSGS